MDVDLIVLILIVVTILVGLGTIAATVMLLVRDQAETAYDDPSFQTRKTTNLTPTTSRSKTSYWTNRQCRQRHRRRRRLRGTNSARLETKCAAEEFEPRRNQRGG